MNWNAQVEPEDAGRGRKCKIYFPCSEMHSSRSCYVAAITQWLPKQAATSENTILHQSQTCLSAGFPSKCCSQATEECSSSPDWTTWAASEASLCSDEWERCFHSCLWLRALASSHADNTRTHYLTHTPSLLPRFPSIHSREWRLHPSPSRCKSGINSTAEAVSHCEDQKMKQIMPMWEIIFGFFQY